jgi:outer membrane autotransporter protein|nr:autotransporter outer membrane beta-barrel domain-containing protein [Pseudomonas sp. GW101-3H06]
MTLLPLLLTSTHSLARIIDGGLPVEIDSSVPAESYLLRNAAHLMANGATTHNIRAESNSSVTLNASTVTSVTSNVGVELVDSNATITGSSVIGNREGLSLGSAAAAPVGSTATVTDSLISGGNTGITAGDLSKLTLNRSVVTSGTTGRGLQLANGSVSATASTIRGGDNGVLFVPSGSVGTPGRLVLDSTLVQGQNGAAIVVNDFGLAPVSATIEVNNGSTLVGGNGRILQVDGVSTANLTVDNSLLVGDVVAGSGATANITLQNHATLTGQLENVNRLAINSDARWVMVGDGSVANMELNGGAVQFGNRGEFFKLTVGNLSGTGGTFSMHTNFGQIDTLTVTGTATGNHSVEIDASGFEPVAAGAIPVIHIAAGDAEFSLRDGPVDLGAYSYELLKQGNNDWYLNTATKVISPAAASVMALSNATPTVWNGELTTLRSRMGEVRMDHGKAGGWVRAYGNKFDVDAGSGAAYQQSQQGFSFGADTPVGDEWLVGLLAGYSQSELNLSHGTRGTVDSYYAGLYTTWLAANGYYFDGVVKFNHFQNASDVRLSDGKKTKGDYNTNAVGASLEFGRHIKLADDYFVEPYTQLSGVIVQGKSYALDNGLTAEADHTGSLLAEVGATAGRNFILGEGKVIQPYLRAAYMHEFARSNEVKVNNNAFNNDLSGSRGELGAGIALTLTDRVSLHADVEYSKGDKIEQPLGFNIGARYSW